MYETAVLSVAASGDVSIFLIKVFICDFTSRLAKFAFLAVLSLFSADLCVGNALLLVFKIDPPRIRRGNTHS